jgi:hypothetical protein
LEAIMSVSPNTRRFSYFGSLAAALALTLAAIAIPLSPAKAQGWVGFQIGPFGFSVAAPGYVYPYYPYPYYPYYYYPGYYYPGYYYYGY